MQIVNRYDKVYGRLTVKGIARTPPERRGAYWHCECKCGNEKVVRGDNLRRGVTISCGCYRRECSTTNIRKLNAKGLNNAIKKRVLTRV